MLWIDLKYVNPSIVRLYNQEFETVYEKLKNAKKIGDFDPIKELAISEIETKKLLPFEK